MNSTVRRAVRELREQLEQIYGDRLSRVLLYGSHARGEGGPDSDVDVLVVLKGEVDPGAEIARTNEVKATLSLEHDLVLSTFFMSEDRFLNRQGPLLRNVRREGVEV